MTWIYFFYHWPFVQGINQLLKDSQHRGPAMQSFVDFCIVSLDKLLKKYLSDQYNKTALCLCDITLMWNSIAIQRYPPY